MGTLVMLLTSFDRLTQQAPAVIERVVSGGSSYTEVQCAAAGTHAGTAHVAAGSRQNIEEHYDAGNAMYRLFLDDTLTYSAGIHSPGLQHTQLPSGRLRLQSDQLMPCPAHRQNSLHQGSPFNRHDGAGIQRATATG